MVVDAFKGILLFCPLIFAPQQKYILLFVEAPPCMSWFLIYKRMNITVDGCKEVVNESLNLVDNLLELICQHLFLRKLRVCGGSHFKILIIITYVPVFFFPLKPMVVVYDSLQLDVS